jgi:hypothetical protein
MKKRKKVFDMARTDLFTVHITEKGQAILTCTVVSYEAWAGGVKISDLDFHYTKK